MTHWRQPRRSAALDEAMFKVAMAVVVFGMILSVILILKLIETLGEVP